MAVMLVTRQHPRRAAVEEKIREIYWDRFAAMVWVFPALLFVTVDRAGGLESAAGMRFGDGPFFSEHYFDEPVADRLANTAGTAIRRERIVEIGTLIAMRSGAALPLARTMVAFGRDLGAEWAIFTATAPLRALLRRSGLPMIDLGRAERDRVPNPESWGRYYDHDPRILAVHRADLEKPGPAVAPAWVSALGAGRASGMVWTHA